VPETRYRGPMRAAQWSRPQDRDWHSPRAALGFRRP